MIVVSNTSPLTNLAAIGRFELLRDLYTEIYIPTGVWAELNAEDQQWPGSLEVERSGWIHRQKPRNEVLVATLLRDLDNGEAETIALALELECERVVIDERDGRRFAQRHGLPVVGTIGLLVDAKNRGLLDKIKSDLDALRQKAGFFISEGLYREVMASVGED
jgi:predicted nucleic acid-binding protein